jgi:hypothetical protein
VGAVVSAFAFERELSGLPRLPPPPRCARHLPQALADAREGRRHSMCLPPFHDVVGKRLGGVRPPGREGGSRGARPAYGAVACSFVSAYRAVRTTSAPPSASLRSAPPPTLAALARGGDRSVSPPVARRSRATFGGSPRRRRGRGAAKARDQRLVRSVRVRFQARAARTTSASPSAPRFSGHLPQCRPPGGVRRGRRLMATSLERDSRSLELWRSHNLQGSPQEFPVSPNRCPVTS